MAPIPMLSAARIDLRRCRSMTKKKTSIILNHTDCPAQRGFNSVIPLFVSIVDSRQSMRFRITKTMLSQFLANDLLSQQMLDS